MDCNAVDALLIQYLNDNLEAEQLWLVRQHLKNCTDCQNRLLILQDSQSLFEDKPLPDSFVIGWRSAIEAETYGKVRQSPWIVRMLAAAASLLVLLGGTMFTGMNRRNAQDVSLYLEQTETNYTEISGSIIEMESMSSEEDCSAAEIDDMRKENYFMDSGEKAIRSANFCLLPEKTALPKQETIDYACADNDTVLSNQNGIAVFLDDFLTFLTNSWPYLLVMTLVVVMIEIIIKRRKIL